LVKKRYRKQKPPKLKPEEITFTDHALYQFQIRFSFNGNLVDLLKLLREKILPNIIPKKMGKYSNYYQFFWQKEEYTLIIRRNKVITLLYPGWKKFLKRKKKRRR
jgi:hypothetical protein